MKKQIEVGKEMLAVQGNAGNWDYDAYMHGLYNGMEFMLSIMEEREPEFRKAPKQWLSKISLDGLESVSSSAKPEAKQ